MRARLAAYVLLAALVLLLPAIVWLAAYKLLFLRQFGDAYDVWAGVVTPVGASQPPPPPPNPAL